MNDVTTFTEEIRDFLNDKLTPELRHYGEAYPGFVSPRPVAEEWTGILNEHGWSVPGWPKQHGGAGWSAEQIMIFRREQKLAHAPRLMFTGENMVGPVVIEYGTVEQKESYLPGIRTGKQWWAQGYSEPNAGSDLSALSTRAEKDGDHYIINGTKIWTSHAHVSDKIFCLVRTNTEGKPQAGMSFLLFDLNLPGIEICPIISFGGEHEFNQIFFENVRVPISSLLGKENDGWTVSKYLLTSERSYSYASFTHSYLRRIRHLSNETNFSGEPPLICDDEYKNKLVKAEIDLMCLDAMEQKAIQLMKTSMVAASGITSANKVHGTHLQQRVTELAVELLAYYAIPRQPKLENQDSYSELIGESTTHTALAVAEYFADRAMTIAGGTTEIQKNIIAKMVLGL